MPHSYLTPIFFISFYSCQPTLCLNATLMVSIVHPNTYHHSLLPPSVLNAFVRKLSQGEEEDNLLHDQKGKKTQIPSWVLKVFTGCLALPSPNQSSWTEVLSPIFLFLTSLPNLCASFSQTHKLNLIYYSFFKRIMEICILPNMITWRLLLFFFFTRWIFKNVKHNLCFNAYCKKLEGIYTKIGTTVIFGGRI